MEILLKSPFPIFSRRPISTFLIRPTKPSAVAIKPPPPDFDFRSSDIYLKSRATISTIHPELTDLAESGTLFLVEKGQFGPVPAWRTEFVEPEAIWLVGTSHVSSESAVEVERVVRAVKPDNVVVELCRSRQVRADKMPFGCFFVKPTSEVFVYRAGIMYTSSNEGGEAGQELKSSMFSLSGREGFFGAIGRSLNLGGQTALALRLLLAIFSSKVSSDVNRPFGDEFRAARKLSEEVGAQLVLGDRPIEITLERAWNSLKWSERLSLVTAVVKGITATPTQPGTTKATADGDDTDASFRLYEQLGFSYPSLLPPLIHERDTYLAWSLKRSKAVNGGKNVVGVIGKGHMNGVVYALVSDLGDLRFRDLVGQRSSDGGGGSSFVASAGIKILKSLLRDTLIGVVLWLIYELVKDSIVVSP
ncbi:unnamed protein product [Linum tenue]|uniref:TraB domain-containing protein n=1 Tax=Linum tenue TaxID=586396 RepID=A0AAV0QPC0_9ROSI|nr:unnamed protein product [Linum tenue]